MGETARVKTNLRKREEGQEKCLRRKKNQALDGVGEVKIVQGGVRKEKGERRECFGHHQLLDLHGCHFY